MLEINFKSKTTPLQMQVLSIKIVTDKNNFKYKYS